MPLASHLWEAFTPLQCGTPATAFWTSAFRDLQASAPSWSHELSYMALAAACDMNLRPVSLIVALASIALGALWLLLKGLHRLIR